MINELIMKLNEKNIPYVNNGKGIKIKGNSDFDIDIYDEGHELTLAMGETHCHRDTIEEALKIIDYSLSGKLKIVNKLRGTTVVGSQIQIVDSDGNNKVLEYSGSLLSILYFWKKKSFEERYFKKI